MSRLVPLLCASLLTLSAWAQQNPDSGPSADEPLPPRHSAPSAKHDIGAGAGDIGIGAAKGAGHAAKGVGKGTLDLVTLHPVNAAGAMGKGAVQAGKDVTVGTARGGARIGRGVGKLFKKL